MDIRKHLEASGNEELMFRLDELEKQAALGRSYMEKLRAEVVRLGALADCGIEPATLRTMADKLDERELLGMKKAYGEKVKGLFPTAAQLMPAATFGAEENITALCTLILNNGASAVVCSVYNSDTDPAAVSYTHLTLPTMAVV